MTQKTKLCILVEIDLDKPLKSSLEADVLRRLEHSAYDFILARGGDCTQTKASVQKPAPATQGETA